MKSKAIDEDQSPNYNPDQNSFLQSSMVYFFVYNSAVKFLCFSYNIINYP